MISEQEVNHIAKLARVELTKEEIKKFQSELSVILDYFELLKKVPFLELKKEKEKEEDFRNLFLREDIAKPSHLVEEILKVAPDLKESYIKVKAVF